MMFGIPLALLALAFGGIVVLAHSLFRGKKKPLFFPALRFAEAHDEASKANRYLDDRILLLVRLLLLGCVVLLGASPFLACERLGIERKGDAAMGLGIVLDDSASMKTNVRAGQRFALARSAAIDLVKGARSDDSIAIVLAGAPARLLVQGSGGSEELVSRLEALGPTDRGTDLGAGIRLAEASLAQFAENRSIVVLSDAASAELDETKAAVSMPLAALREPVENCSIDSARLHTGAVRFELSCTSDEVLEGRRIELGSVRPESSTTPLGFTSLAIAEARSGAMSFPLPEGKKGPFAVRLSKGKTDESEFDDFAFVAEETRGKVLVLAGRAIGRTSSTPLVELALRALDKPLEIVPAITLFGEKEAENYAAVIIEDPTGFSAEESLALEKMVVAGGVALVFFGPNIERAPLGHGAHPFLSSIPSFESTKIETLAPEPTLEGSVYLSWDPLGNKKRVVPKLDADHRVIVHFQDGSPLLFEKSLGAGLALATTLPSSEKVSDLALRPAFLALLDRVTDEALHRMTRETVAAGTRLPLKRDENAFFGSRELTSEVGSEGSFVEVNDAGLLEVRRGSKKALRAVERPAGETVERPREPKTLDPKVNPKHRALFDISREVALLALTFAAVELALRVRRGSIDSAARPSPDSTSSPIESA